MFEITLNDKTLYHPNSDECNVTNAVIHESLNDAGYMDLTVPYKNPLYAEIVERKGKIVVYKDNVAIWYGEVRDISVDFSRNKTVYVVGEATYLNDTVQPQRLIKGTKYQVLQDILNYHNAICDMDKQFQPGAIGKDAEALVDVVTDWEYSLDAIRTHLCGNEEYFRIRHLNGVRYVDIMPIEDYGKRSTQNIMLGENLLDYAEQSSGEEIASVCIPLGARQDSGGIEGYDNYLTCESANGGKNYVELPGAINRLGRITKVVKFDEVTDATTLVNEAINYLQTSQYAKLTLNLTAVDMSVIHNDIDNYAVGDYIRTICEPMGMDAWLPVRQRDTDLLNLANNSISIGSEGYKSMTVQNAESITELERKMPNRDSILEAAKKNAQQIINSNGTDGYVAIRTDENGKPYEITITDQSTLIDSTKAWRWNLSGLGYGTKEAGASDFTWKPDVAITMAGEIVADYITTGTIDANTVNVVNVKASSVDAENITGTTISGKTISGCTISGSTYEQGDSKGKITIKNGWIYGSSTEGAGSALQMSGRGSLTIIGSKMFYSEYDGKGGEVEGCYVAIAGMDKKSDKRLKENIHTIDTEKSINFVDGTNPCEYNFRNDSSKTRYGFIAQEVENNLKECNLKPNGMIIQGNEYLGLNYQDFIPHLINYVKDLRNEINLLKKGAIND